MYGVVWFGGPGGDRLSRGLSRSIMGAGGFHGRVRDGIGWIGPRHGHQVVRATLGGGYGVWTRACGLVRGCVCVCVCGVWWAVGDFRACGLEWDGACWAIRTSQLSALLRLHIWPIDVMVCHGPSGIAPWETWF